MSLAICAAALVGCGGDTFSLDPVASAATKTVTSQSARVAFTATMDVEGVGGMAFSGSGVFDGRSRSGSLNMRFQLPADAKAQLGGADPTLQMIIDGRSGLVVYMRSPLLARLAGDRWIKFDMVKLAKKQGVDLKGLLNADQADPAQTLDMLKASADARQLGYDHIRGVFTTHYLLNVDLERLANENKNLRKRVDTVREATGTTSYPAEAWVDDAGRIRRLKVEMSSNSAVGGAFTMSMTEDLYAFGTKVQIRAPAASQVLDSSALRNG